MIFGFKKYNIKQVEEKIRKAINNYLKRGGAEGKVLVGNIKLPRIMDPETGKVIDLEEKYKGYTVVAEMIGIVPALLYIDKKKLLNGKEKELNFMHFLKKPAFLVFDPDDPERIYIAFQGKVKMTDAGIIG